MLCLLALVCFAYLFCFALLGLTCEARAVEHQKLKVEFQVFNLLALVCLELARVVLFLGLLAHFTLVWFGWFGSLFCFCLLCCAMLAHFALLALFALFCFTYLVCFGM